MTVATLRNTHALLTGERTPHPLEPHRFPTRDDRSSWQQGITDRAVTVGKQATGTGLKDGPPGIPEAGTPYRARYEFMTGLGPNDRFIFTTMGYLYTDSEAPQAGPPKRQLPQFAKRLYDVVAAQCAFVHSTVLKVGSGRGSGAEFVARVHRPRTYLGLDHSDGNVEFSNQVREARALSFVQGGDTEHLPLVVTGLPENTSKEPHECRRRRSFMERACQKPAHSYTSGRFVFRRMLAVRES
jgi:hypothetical protein